jgi:hypothetical protein
MSLFWGICIFLVAYLVIGAVILGYQSAKKKEGLDDTDILLYLVGWPVLILGVMVIAITYLPAKFGEWVFKKFKEEKE